MQRGFQSSLFLPASFIESLQNKNGHFFQSEGLLSQLLYSNMSICATIHQSKYKCCNSDCVIVNLLMRHVHGDTLVYFHYCMLVGLHIRQVHGANQSLYVGTVFEFRGSYRRCFAIILCNKIFIFHKSGWSLKNTKNSKFWQLWR